MSIRFSGLASGMDIDGIVKSYMAPQQNKIDKAMRNKTLTAWKQESYNTVNSSLARFILDRKADLGLTMSAGGINFDRSFSSVNWIKGASSSKTDVATVTASAGAANGAVKINVRNLAENWSAASADALPEIPKDATTGVLLEDNLFNQLGLKDGDKIDFTIATANGKSIRITNDANAEDGPGVVTIDTKVTKMSDIAYTLNSAGVGVVASYDSNVRRFFIQTAETGEKNTIKITDNSEFSGADKANKKFMTGENNLLNLKTTIDVPDPDAPTGPPIKKNAFVTGDEYKGVDAKLDIGAALGITQSSNNFSVNGVRYSLKGTGASEINVSTDVTSAYDKIKKFVDEYNKVIDDMNVKVKSKYDKSYQPLLDDEKKSMSADQITQWETKGKVGLLKGDSDITSMLNNIRNTMFKDVEGVRPDMNNLAEIGIQNEDFDTSIGGRLQIDENKLKDALQKDAGSVMNLLFRSPDNASEKDQKVIDNQSGAFNRVFNGMTSGIKNIINKAGTGNNEALYRSVQFNILMDFYTKNDGVGSLQKDINTQAKSILDLNTKFTAKQTSLYNRFTAMEKSISNANSQSSWLSSQFAGVQ